MHDPRFVVLPLFVLILLLAVSIAALAADNTRVLFRFDENFDITTVEANGSR